MRISWISKVLSWVAAALVGGVFGVAGTIGHSVSWGPVPVGMIVGTIACGAILVAIRALTHDRGATLAAGLGMVGMLVLISGVGPGGSVVVEDTAYGRVWIYIVAGLVLLAVAWPRFSNLPVTTQSGVSHTSGEAAAPLISEVPGVTGGERTARES